MGHTVTLNCQDYLTSTLSDTTAAFKYLLQLAKFSTVSKAEVVVNNRIIDVDNPVITPNSISVQANGYQFTHGNGFKRITDGLNIPTECCNVLTVSFTLPESKAVSDLIAALKKFGFFYFS